MPTGLIDAKHLIDGEWVPSAAGRESESFDPATGARVGSFADGGVTEADAAIAAARRAFENPAWAQNPRLRQRVLLDWASRLEAKTDEIAELLVRENGKILAQARGEMAGAVSEICYYAGLARNIPGHVMEVEPGIWVSMVREPAGVAGIIVPWNAPAILLIRSLAPALCAGCTAVVKPAAQTTLVTAAIFRELADVPNLPRGVVNLVGESGHAVAARLVASPDVAVLSFTGSTALGQRIMADAAPTMKKLSLELGGKSCCLVFPDVDVQSVARSIASAATVISGQQCTAARRVLVHASRAAEMKASLRDALSRLVVGPGLDSKSQLGPLIDERARAGVEAALESSFASCDEVVLRGGRPNGALAAGSFLTPSLIAHSDPDAFFCQDEIFGPLVVLETFEQEAEAISRANNTVFGLAASVWTHDGARSLRVARALRNGTVWINDHNKLMAEAAMGGYRLSGLGRLHGTEALADFTETKTIYQDVGVVTPAG